MKFEVVIESDNDVFATEEAIRHELPRILHEVARKIGVDPWLERERVINDLNGTKVGWFRISEVPEEDEEDEDEEDE